MRESQVENFVCPRCARLHGHAHAPGCPSDINDVTPAYEAGWDAAKTAFADMARWAAEDERKKILKGLRLMFDSLEEHL